MMSPLPLVPLIAMVAMAVSAEVSFFATWQPLWLEMYIGMAAVLARYTGTLVPRRRKARKHRKK